MEVAQMALTLNDVRITTAMLTPVFDAAKSAFWMIVPFILGLLALKVAVWIAPVILKKLFKK